MKYILKHRNYGLVTNIVLENGNSSNWDTYCDSNINNATPYIFKSLNFIRIFKIQNLRKYKDNAYSIHKYDN